MKRGFRSRDEYFNMAALPNGREHARLGLAISRRASPKSVVRNRLKRYARESFRRNQERLDGVDIVVTAQAAAADAAPAQLNAALVRHWERIASQCRKS